MCVKILKLLLVIFSDFFNIHFCSINLVLLIGLQIRELTFYYKHTCTCNLVGKEFLLFCTIKC